jgi:hypothetical protein
MNLTSTWKLTLDPAGTTVVLLDYDQELAEDLSWSFQRGTEVVTLEESAAVFLRDKKSHVYSLGFTVFSDESTDSDSRRAIMVGLIAASALTKKPLKVEAMGVTDVYWIFSSCIVTDHDPQSVIPFPLPRIQRVYRITATGLSQVTV